MSKFGDIFHRLFRSHKSEDVVVPTFTSPLMDAFSELGSMPSINAETIRLQLENQLQVARTWATTLAVELEYMDNPQDILKVRPISRESSVEAIENYKTSTNMIRIHSERVIALSTIAPHIAGLDEEDVEFADVVVDFWRMVEEANKLYGEKLEMLADKYHLEFVE